jgi:hypothetical protein
LVASGVGSPHGHGSENLVGDGLYIGSHQSHKIPAT